VSQVPTARRWPDLVARFACGVALGVLVRLIALPLRGLPVFSLLGLTSVGFVSAAVLFGWPGVAGIAGVQAVVLYLRPASPLYFVSSLGGYVLAGAFAYWTFRRVPRLGRGLPDLRSCGWLTLAGGLGAVLSSSIVSWVGHESTFWDEASVWMRSTVVSVWLLAPAVLILADRTLRRLLVPIPGELRERPRPVEEAGPPSPGEEVEEQASRSERRKRERLGPVSAVVVLATIVVTALKVLIDFRFPQAGSWPNLLYLVPIYWAASRAALAGGLMASALAGLCYMGGQAAAAVWSGDAVAQPLEIYAQLLVFCCAGALLGEAQAREADLLAALAASNRRLRRDLQRVVQALSGAVEAKDLYTEGHLQRVNSYAHEVGFRLGLRGRDLELLQIAGALHDVGKIGIPEQLLNKAGRLTEAEVGLMQRHPEIGARILANIDGFGEAAALVRHHQERWDGRRDGDFPGYPSGLAGEAIPLGARIIAVVDAFDAMTTDRPYRAAMPANAAAEVLRGERGGQFDPRVVDTFLAVLAERPWE
jgi:hypothetical protein